LILNRPRARHHDAKGLMAVLLSRFHQSKHSQWMPFDCMNRSSHRAKSMQVAGKMFRPNDLGWHRFEQGHRKCIGSKMSFIQIDTESESRSL
jgi:hypothetical protein